MIKAYMRIFVWNSLPIQPRNSSISDCARKLLEDAIAVGVLASAASLALIAAVLVIADTPVRQEGTDECHVST